MNLAILLGCLNYITGLHTVKWERTER
jgi:hypothetical protein